MDIKKAAEIATKVPMNYQSARAGEELSELGHSPSQNTELKSDEREAREAEELQIRRAAMPGNSTPHVGEVWAEWSKQEDHSWLTAFWG